MSSLIVGFNVQEKQFHIAFILMYYNFFYSKLSLLE
jgi:hypothetical protein